MKQCYNKRVSYYSNDLFVFCPSNQLCSSILKGLVHSLHSFLVFLWNRNIIGNYSSNLSLIMCCIIQQSNHPSIILAITEQMEHNCRN